MLSSLQLQEENLGQEMSETWTDVADKVMCTLSVSLNSRVRVVDGCLDNARERLHHGCLGPHRTLRGRMSDGAQCREVAEESRVKTGEERRW